MAAPDPPRRNVYVVVAGSLALRNHLAVREALRGDPVLRAAYGELKRRLADEVKDSAAYVARKTEFLTGILTSVGFTPSEIDAIRSANKPPR